MVSTPPSDASGPTAPEDRIVGIDALRGFALLGILVINVWLFGLPTVAWKLPSVYGEFSGANYLAWLVSHVAAEMKFMTLFTLLFGAGIVLFARSKARADQSVLGLHYRRTTILLVVGLGHAYLLWSGDILVSYALCGFLAIWARNWRPRTLALVGLALVAVPSVIYLVAGFLASGFPEEVLAGLQGTDAQIQAEIAAYRGGWVDQMGHRVGTSLITQTAGFAVYLFWRVLGTMLFGMALLKTGVLTNERSDRFYWRLLLGGGTLGLAVVLAGVAYRHAHDWGVVESVFFAIQFNYWGSFLLAGAYVAAIMLWVRHRPAGAVTGTLAAVGRTAFSNYLLQTVLATTIFYGHGLGWFARLDRVELLGVVVAIWAVQIPLSVLWLRRFRYGPVEWVWRTLTYGERQPLLA